VLAALVLLAALAGVGGTAAPAAATPDSPATVQSANAAERAASPTTTDDYFTDVCRASNPNVNGYFLTYETHVLELLDPASTGHAHIWVYCHFGPYVGVVTFGPLDKAITWHMNPLPEGPISAYTMPHQGWACPQLHDTGVVCNRSSC
jgi:hypothetical protein